MYGTFERKIGNMKKAIRIAYYYCHQQACTFWDGSMRMESFRSMLPI